MPANGKAEPLKDDEFVISADEKTSIQARRRKHATQTCRPRTPMRVEHEYFRCGAWTYIAALGRPPRQGLRPLRSTAMASRPLTDSSSRS